MMKAYPLLPTAARARDYTESDIAELDEALRINLEGEVRSDRGSRMLYATDASIYQMVPLCVVFPTSEMDVQHVLRTAKKAGVPVLPRGGGTSLAGQGVNHAIVMDFSPRMSRIREINVEEGWARVQPGLVLGELNRTLASRGLQYGIDPSTANRATIGGGIGNNSCGAHSIVYGKTIDNVLGMRAILSDATTILAEPTSGAALEAKLQAQTLEGNLYREMRRLGRQQREEIARRYPKILRRVSGYNLDDFINEEAPMDLSRMIVGSEGTLAVVTEAKVKLQSIPKLKGVAAVHFKTIVEAAEGTVAALDHEPSAVELMDSVIVTRCRSNPSFSRLARWVEGDPGGILVIEFTGETEAELKSKLEKLEADLDRRKLGYATVATTDAALQRDMWRMREAGLGLIMSNRSDTKAIAYVEDTAVSPEKLPQFVARFQEIAGKLGTEAAYYGHASVGCLHIRPAVNVKSAEGIATMQAIANEVADLVLEFGGSLSGEHGDGILRGVFTEKMFGSQLTEAFREVKRAFDPEKILNPGKIIDTPGFTENLRASPQTHNWEPVTFLDFSFEGGIARAAEQCNGQGACRKLDGGMCPSYMATLDEEHSTRGRANLLRLAFSGVLPREELTGDRIHQALDLCVECKACKAECPSGVDMAKLKYEVLAQRHKAHGTPLRARAFANIATLARIGSKMWLLSNIMARMLPVKAALHRGLGIHSERPLPAFASQTFPAWFAKLTPNTEAPRGEIVLFNDTFTDYFNPEVGKSAVRVLEALGYRVVLVEQTVCCGRPAISKGLLDMAKDLAHTNVEALLPYARCGIPIVGTEPSCMLSFRDEYPELLRNNEAREVGAMTYMLDEWLGKLALEDPSVAEIFRPNNKREVVLHAHCHQKASIGADPTLHALSLAGYTPRLIETSCCGMAGSFGFEAEHYEISRSMGALRLFPAVESASHEAAIAITGVSCRQQIDHFTSRKPQHAVELLAEALK
jgi:FAD/FMN-containing dehydrogenase/Fe-S oxidoreductase